MLSKLVLLVTSYSSRRAAMQNIHPSAFQIHYSPIQSARLNSTQLNSTGWVESGRALWTLWRPDSTQLNSTSSENVQNFADWSKTARFSVFQLSWVELSRKLIRKRITLRLNSTQLNSTASWVELSWVGSGALNWAYDYCMCFQRTELVFSKRQGVVRGSISITPPNPIHQIHVSDPGPIRPNPPQIWNLSQPGITNS